MRRFSREVLLPAAPLILFVLLQALPASGGRLWGRILDDHGRPIPRAQIQLWDVANPQLTPATVSSARGRYAFNNLAQGVYYVSAKAPNYIAEQAGPLGVPQDSATPRDIHLQRIQYAASGALLNLDDKRAPRQFAAAKLLNDRTQMLLLALYLQAKHPEYAQEVRDAQEKIGSTGVISGKVSMISFGIAGAANAQLEILNTLTGVEETVTPDSEGKYTVDVLPVGTYQVQLIVPGFATEVKKGVKVKLHSTVTINFRVNPARGPGDN